MRMGIADRLRRAAGEVAQAVGQGVDRAEGLAREAAQAPAARKALDTVRDMASRTSREASELVNQAAPALREAAERAVPAVRAATGRAAASARDVLAHAEPALNTAAEKVAASARDVAGRVEPAVRETVARAGGEALHVAHDAGELAADTARRAQDAATQAARTAAGKAGATVASVAGSARTAATRAAVKNAAGMREASARPHEVTDPRTGQKVVVEAYVRRPGGGRDYDAVYPRGAMGDFGPIGNKAVGAMLLMAGLPMLVLPGPGAAAVAAGLYFLRKDGSADAGTSDSATGTATMGEKPGAASAVAPESPDKGPAGTDGATVGV